MPSTGCQGEGQEGQPGARPGWVQPTVLMGTCSPVLMSLSLFFRLTAPKIPEGEKVDFDVSLRDLGLQSPQAYSLWLQAKPEEGASSRTARAGASWFHALLL